MFEVAQNLRGSEEKFIFLSPFAGWTLAFEATDGVDFSHVSQIVLTFKASTIPASSSPMHALVASRMPFMRMA